MMSLPTMRDSTRSQHIGNTKKKRISLSYTAVEESPPQPPVPDSPEPRASYGDPMKIAQYFPELN